MLRTSHIFICDNFLPCECSSVPMSYIQYCSIQSLWTCNLSNEEVGIVGVWITRSNN